MTAILIGRPGTIPSKRLALRRGGFAGCLRPFRAEFDDPFRGEGIPVPQERCDTLSSYSGRYPLSGQRGHGNGGRVCSPRLA